MSWVKRAILVCIALLVVAELVLSYDVLQRRIALATTSLISIGVVVLVDRRLHRRVSLRLPDVVYLVAALSLTYDALGNFLGTYGSLWWWDDVAHTIGTASLAAFISAWVDVLQRSGRARMSRTMQVFVVIAFAILVSSIYELTEYWGDLLFATHRVGPGFDTVTDLQYNLIGAVGTTLLLLPKHARRDSRD